VRGTTREGIGTVSTRVQHAIDLLGQLDHLLEVESIALDTLDWKAIDGATQAKEALEPALEAALADLELANDRERDAPSPEGRAPSPEGRDAPSPEGREAVSTLRERVAKRAQQNHRRLAALHNTVRGLLGALVGDERPTYGRRARGVSAYGTGTSRAILTAEVG